MEDYKEKYEQAMFRMNKWAEGSEITDPKEVAEFVFPELKESEDERIRKALIQHIKDKVSVISGWRKEELIAWLEKQGEQIDIVNKEYWRGYREGKQEILDKYADLEKQGEQKSTDKVEPKFKVGDWIVTPNNETKQIEKVTFGNYYFTDKTIYNVIDTDNNGHFWTIEDAKDGDVLCYRNDVFLVKHYVLFNKVVSHCTYGERFIPHNTYSFTRADFIKIYPAPKEQRDLLFTKMKEAGYGWNSEKKELEKMDTYCQENCKGFQETRKCFCDGECKAKKEHIKQNLQDNDFSRIEQKPAEWSEEDEGMLQKTLSTIRYALSIPMDKEDDPCFVGSSTISWLKSIKERMKGE